MKTLSQINHPKVSDFFTERTHLFTNEPILSIYDSRFPICDLRASWSMAQACSFRVPKTKRGHNKTCNFAKRSQIPRRLVFHSSCYGAGNCERFLATFPKGNFEKRSQFIHLRFPIADLRFANRQRKRIYGVSSAEFEAKPNLIRLNPTKNPSESEWIRLNPSESDQIRLEKSL